MFLDMKESNLSIVRFAIQLSQEVSIKVPVTKDVKAVCVCQTSQYFANW